MAISQKDIIYFIITDRFYGKENPDFKGKIDKSNPFKYHGGNFDGIIEKIPYFKKLGVNVLWITPVYLQLDLPTVDGYHGYWALDFNSINPILYIDKGKYPKGSKQYLKDLVDELHKNGIKLILDMVVNHTGYNHPAFTSEHNPTPIKPSWFHSGHISLEQNEIEGGLAALPDFDLDQTDVCDYHIQTIISWIKETGIDGIRMDTVKHVERDFWNYYKTQIKGTYPDINLLGEVLVFDIDTLSAYQKYWAFDELFDFPLQQAIRDVFLYDKPMTVFVSPFNKGNGILEKDKAYTNHNRLVTLLDNHDLSARFFSWAMQNQMGDKDKATMLYKMALTFMFTVRGIPQLYYGTEYGMEGHHDPDNRRDFNWDLFTKTYDIKKEYKHEKEIFDLTCNLIKARKENQALISGQYVCLYVDDYILVSLRYVDNEIVVTTFHNGWLDMPHAINIDLNVNYHIPLRIKDILMNKTLKSVLTTNTLQISNGILSVKFDKKSADILN